MALEDLTGYRREYCCLPDGTDTTETRLASVENTSVTGHNCVCRASCSSTSTVMCVNHEWSNVHKCNGREKLSSVSPGCCYRYLRSVHTVNRHTRHDSCCPTIKLLSGVACVATLIGKSKLTVLTSYYMTCFGQASPPGCSSPHLKYRNNTRRRSLL